jgi:hypothetical protein
MRTLWYEEWVPRPRGHRLELRPGQREFRTMLMAPDARFAGRRLRPRGVAAFLIPVRLRFPTEENACQKS